MFIFFCSVGHFFLPPEAKQAPRQIRRRVHYKARNIKRSKRKAKLLAETKIARVFLPWEGRALRAISDS